jgi:hypothetical protein
MEIIFIFILQLHNLAIMINDQHRNIDIPLFFEMACEAAYPVPEGTTNLVLTLSSNVGGLVFLLIQMIPNIGQYTM